MTDIDREAIAAWLQAADADTINRTRPGSSPWPWRYAKDVRLLLREVDMNDPARYQTVKLVLTDGTTAIFTGPVQIDPYNPPGVTEVIVTPPREMDADMKWTKLEVSK